MVDSIYFSMTNKGDFELGVVACAQHTGSHSLRLSKTNKRLFCEEYENICYISIYSSASDFLSIISKDLV